jgi:serine/threonine-protein kinase
MAKSEAQKSETPTTAEGKAGPSSEAPKRPSQRPGGAVALVGMVISGRYRIDRLLGEGGMGAVYEAEHTHMRKRLAVKVLHAEMSRLPEVVARFEREAMAAAHIDHPNVAGATDFGKLEDGSFFLVLEYVEGHSLREAIGKGRLELGRALRITFQIAQALQRAHALGIVHRDLKPENVMLVERDGEADFVKVLDFGIAKVPMGELASAESGGPKVLTQMGMVYGTPEYMAPEQALGQTVDPRADLYALGVMLYEMLAGVRPFEAESKVGLLGMHVTARVPPFAERCPEALVPPEVEAIVMKLLAKEAKDRFADAKELAEAISATTNVLVERQRIEPQILHVAKAPSTSSPNLAPLSGVLSGRSPMASPVVPLGAPASIRSPLTSAPTRPVSDGGAPPITPLARRASRAPGVIVWVAGIASAALLALLLLNSRRHGKDTDAAAEGGIALVAADAAPPEPKDDDDDARIAAALASIDKGDYGTGIATLTTLEPRDMDRSDIHRALMKAYLATSDTANAVREATLLVKSDATAAGDPKLQEDVRNAALGKGDAANQAFALLEGGMGEHGVDVLYEMAYSAWSGEYPSAAARAAKDLGRPEIHAKGSPAAQIALDLRAASTCPKKHDLLQRAADVGDYRVLPLLKSYAATRGCGFLGARDCWPCMHKDGALAAAIKAAEARVPPKK